MQNIKKTLKSKRFWLGTVLPFALAVAAAFVARYQLEISDGVTANYMVGQWPVYAPLNALTAFCLTLVVFALCGSWGIATGISGLIFTVLALINYYTRDLHGSALMPQDILNLGTAAEVTETEEKVNTLRLLCRKLAPENPYWQGDFHDCIGHTAVWRITVDAITGKANRGKQNA